MEVKLLLVAVVILTMPTATQTLTQGDRVEDGPCGRLYFFGYGTYGSQFGEISMPLQNGTILPVDSSIAVDVDYLPNENVFLFVSDTGLISWNPETNVTEGPILDIRGMNTFFLGIEVDQLRNVTYFQIKKSGSEAFGRMFSTDRTSYEISASDFAEGEQFTASFVFMDELSVFAVSRPEGIFIHKMSSSSAFDLRPTSTPVREGSPVIAMTAKGDILYYSLGSPVGTIFCVNVRFNTPCSADGQSVASMDLALVGFYADYFFLTFLEPSNVQTVFELFDINGMSTGLCLLPSFDGNGPVETEISEYKYFHFMEDESMCPKNEDEKPEYSVLIRPPSIRLKNSRSVVIHQNFPEGYQASFDRAAYTGNARGVPVDIDQTHDRVVLKKKRRGPRKAVGVYEHAFQSEMENVGESILSILQWSGKLRFTHTTRTVYEGDMLFLSTPLRSGRARRWRFNGKLLPQWNGSPSLTIPSVNEGHEGIYEIYLNGRRSRAAHGIARVIVPDCPRNTYNAPSCDESTFRLCYNGGIPRTDRDECICAPGFMGENCETFANVGFYGQQGQFQCPEGSCRGVMICLPDPYGCSCAAGYHGPDCDLPCRETTYGADCRGKCYCGGSGEESCDPYTGVCISSDCTPGYSGVNCQESIN